jgi:hypothetical protein
MACLWIQVKGNMAKKNKKAAAILEKRRQGYDNVPEHKKGGYKRPGSMKKS